MFADFPGVLQGVMSYYRDLVGCIEFHRHCQGYH